MPLEATGASSSALRIALVSDFFHPNPGGVEAHVRALAAVLLMRGHHVVVVSRAYFEEAACGTAEARRRRVGVRHLEGGLKVYHLPLPTVYNGAVLPAVFTAWPLLRCVFVREQIDIVHGHSAFSPLAHDALLLAQTMRLQVARLCLSLALLLCFMLLIAHPYCIPDSVYGPLALWVLRREQHCDKHAAAVHARERRARHLRLPSRRNEYASPCQPRSRKGALAFARCHPVIPRNARSWSSQMPSTQPCLRPNCTRTKFLK